MHEAEVRPGRAKPNNLRDQVANMHLWPTPTANEDAAGTPGGGNAMDAEPCRGVRLQDGEGIRGRVWSTPTSSDWKRVGPTEGYAMSRKFKAGNLPIEVAFPTPCTTGFSNGSGNVNRANELYESGVLSEEERRSFRAGNGGKLNPDWTEALMLWPTGWSSLEPMRREDFRLWKERAEEGTLWAYDPAELPEDDERYVPRTAEGIPHRADRLKAIGNGQVPSAAALAETILQRALEKYR